MASKDEDKKAEETDEDEASEEEEAEESDEEEADDDSSDDEDDEDDEDEESADDEDAEKPVVKASAKKKADDHGHGHDDDHDHGLAHVTPLWLLFAVLGSLLVLTFLTVAITYVDLGVMNLAGALIIATVKASLVVTFFMHLKWDKGLNSFAFLASVLFVALFISLAMTDRSEYQKDIEEFDLQNPPAPAPAHAAEPAHGPAAEHAAEPAH